MDDKAGSKQFGNCLPTHTERPPPSENTGGDKSEITANSAPQTYNGLTTSSGILAASWRKDLELGEADLQAVSDALNGFGNMKHCSYRTSEFLGRRC